MDINVIFWVALGFGIVIGVVGDRLGLFRFLDEPTKVKQPDVVEVEDDWDQRVRPAEPVRVPTKSRGPESWQL